MRAIIQKNEISERALQLTADAIALNSANYTIWFYRRQCLFGLKKDLDKELEYLNKIIVSNPKNYQVWYHRQVLMEKLRKPDTGVGELPFIELMLKKDAKNYHAWAYR